MTVETFPQTTPEQPTPAEMMDDLREISAPEPHNELLLRLERLEKFETAEQADEWLDMATVVLTANVDKQGNPDNYNDALYGVVSPERAQLLEAGITKAEYNDENGVGIIDLSVSDTLKHTYNVRYSSSETTITRTVHPGSSEHRYTEGVSLIDGQEGAIFRSIGVAGEVPQTKEELEKEFIDKVTGLRVALYTALSTDQLEKYGLDIDERAQKAFANGVEYRAEREASKKARSFGGRVMGLFKRGKAE